MLEYLNATMRLICRLLFWDECT